MPLFGTGKSLREGSAFGQKTIGVITPLEDHGFRLQVYDNRRGVFISSEEAVDLSKGVADRGIDGFYLNLPLRMLGFRVLNLPFSDKKRLKEVIPFEIQGLILSDVNDIVFDTFCLGREGEGFSILVLYIERELLGSILERLSIAGIDPAIVSSIEVSSIIRNTVDKALIVERLVGYGDNGSIKAEDIKEELKEPLINLRKGPFEYRGEKIRVSKVFRITTFILIIIAIIINIDLILRIQRERQDIALMKQEMKKSYSKLFPSEKRVVDETYQLKAHLKEAKEIREFAGGVSGLEILLNLSRLRSKGIVLNEIGISREGLSIKGEAESMDEIERLKQGLSEIVTMPEVSNFKPITNERNIFTLSGRLKR